LLYGGDIATVQLEGPDGGPAPVSLSALMAASADRKIEVIGSIDSGIKAAAWSPDEEHLVIVTGMFR
jgi:elongator complex protein 1